MLRKLAALTAAGALALSLSACSSSATPGGAPELDPESGTISTDLYERSIKLEDGRVITCVIFVGSRKGGLSCDWNPVAESVAE